MFAKMASDMMIKPGQVPVFNSPKDFDLKPRLDRMAQQGIKLTSFYVGRCARPRGPR